MGTRLAFSPNRPAFSLPGGWPSTDSLEETFGLHPLDEEPLPIVSNIPRTERVKRGSLPNAAGQKSLRDSVATYDDDSDDFYSFVEADENGDEELASLPDAGDIRSVCSNQSNPSNGPFQVAINIENSGSEDPGTLATSASPSINHAEDMFSSDDTSSSSQKLFGAPARETSVSTLPSDVSNFTLQSDCNFPQSRPTFLTKDAVSNPRISLATSSSRQSINSVSSSSGSARLGDEEFSHHLDHSEDESAVSHTQVDNVIDDAHYSNDSEESLPVHMHSSPRVRRSLQIQRRAIGNQENQLDILHLAQPDGDNPWTLSLEPTLLHLSEFATASRTSVSADSSSIAHDVVPAASSEPRLPTPVSPRTPTARSFAVAQNEFMSGVSLGRPSVDSRPSHYAPPPSYSGFTIPQTPEKKAVVQKTKNLYQKMKRFFTPKSSQRNEGRGNSNELSVTTLRNTGFSPLPFSLPYGNESSSQWSLNRRAFQRSAKSSAPSVTLSCTPDIPYNSSYHLPPGVTPQTPRRTFENKRNRRFSVPTPFSAPSNTPSSSRNISVPSSRPFGKRWSRISESEH